VSFPPELDELMGVTNNKQEAHRLKGLATLETASLCLPGESEADMKLRLAEEDPLYYQLLNVKYQIENFQSRARERYKTLRSGIRTSEGGRHPDAGDAEGTAITKERQVAGEDAEADHLGDQMSEEEIAEANVVALEEDGVDREVAEVLVKWGAELGLLVRTLAVDDETEAFFRPRSLPGTMQVNINRNHPFYNQIWNIVDQPDDDDIDLDEAIERLNTVKHSLKLLMYSWARMELENNDPRDQSTRMTWGKYLRQYLANRPRQD
jgi:hypothetical protein